MQHLKFIGSLSELVDSRVDSRKRKLSLSEEIRLERERLFGGARRKRKNILPSSKKDRSIGTLKISDEEIRISSEMIISRMKDFLNTPIYPINALCSSETGGTEEYIKKEISKRRHDLRKDLISTRIIICYILYHCFNYEQNRVARFYGIHRDFTGAANQILSNRFEGNETEETRFRELFDYFMKLNKREYA